MLKVKHITKQYGNKKALDDVSFALEKGMAAGFLGPNGAGKSTTMNIITGYLCADEGSVSIGGASLTDDPIAYKKMFGYLPEIPPLYGDMTLEEYLAFVCAVKGVEPARRGQEIGRVTEQVRISDVRRRLLGNLSKGYRQRAGFAQALIGSPPLLILDEPTIGLDPSQIVEIRSLLNELKREHTILLSSHILSEVSEVCDRIILLSEGRVVADDTQENLLAGENQTILVRSAAQDAGALRQEVLRVPGVLACDARQQGEKMELRVTAKRTAQVCGAISAALAKGGYPLYELTPQRVSLEDAFIRMTTDSGAREETA